MFNNVLERKETLFGHKKSIFLSLKNRIFPMLLVKKWILFLELFSVKIRPEIMLNSVRDRKETFFWP